MMLSVGGTIFSQAPTIKTTVDSNEILIGGQLHLKITATFPADKYKVNWFAIPDSVEHFEVIEKGKPDSTFENNQLTGVAQTITLTSFDSGKWTLPIFRINFASTPTAAPLSLFSDSVPVTVSFSTADTTSQLKDIKPVYEVSVPFPVWYWVAGVAAVLLLIGVIFFVWRYFKNRKTKQPAVSKLSAYEMAIKALRELETFSLTDPAQVKIFHTKTVDVLRKYLSDISTTGQVNKSTDDLLIVLSGYNLSKEDIAKAATSLRCSDAVKFAKYLPDAATSKESLLAVKDVVEEVNKNITTAEKQPVIKK